MTPLLTDDEMPALPEPVGTRYESRRDLRPMIYRAMLNAAPPAPEREGETPCA